MSNLKWLLIFAAVLLILAGVQVCRVNRPQPEEKTVRPAYTQPGPIVEGEQAVPPQDYLSFNIRTNRRLLLRGEFSTGRKENKVACLVLGAENFEAWKNRLEYQSLADTGPVPSGRIHQVLDPGDYYLIFDNRHSTDERKFNASFAVK